jgi:photosystem II stability/assembly factor-like uncharacterized protein
VSLAVVLAAVPLAAQQPVLVPTNSFRGQLLSVAVYDPQVAIAVGSGGVVLRSQDAGRNWWRIPAGSAAHLEDATFIGVTVFAVGTGGTILRSLDGGVNWQMVLSGVSSRLRSVHFGDALHGIIVGDSGVALMTADGGATWVRGATGVAASLIDVRMAGPVSGVAVGSGVVLRTDDGGRSWRPLGAPGGSTLTGVIFSGSAVSALGLYGTAIFSADGGATWSPVVLPVNQSMSDVDQADATTLFAAGSTATIVRSGDGGRTWTLAYQANGFAFEDVNFADARTGWAVGNNGVIMYTADGGVSWTHQMGMPAAAPAAPAASAATLSPSLYLQVLGLSLAAPYGSALWSTRVGSASSGSRLDELHTTSGGDAYQLTVIHAEGRTCAQLLATLIQQGGQMRTAPPYTPPGWFQVSVERSGTTAFVCLPLGQGAMVGGFATASLQRASPDVMRPILVTLAESAFLRWGRP